MQKPPSKSPKSSFAKYLMAGSGLAMLVVSGAAYAQEAAPVKAGAEDIETVVVVGARAAQQSSNDRKKRAKTAVDSIVADDVGAFPDKNLNEAISRVAGVALQRDEMGEGSTIDIRGNSAELTRVELDGMGVGNTSFALGGAGSARGADLTALPSDLIKTVDVVKGSTADMTEGSLGGGVRIQTRTGLDFKKPYVSLRVGMRRNSLGEKWRPDYNLIASRKFLDGRLGVILSVTGSNYQNNSSQQGTSANNAGYQGRIDFDNSPDKTFTFNPSTVGGTGVGATLNPDTLLANSVYTPRQIVEKSAAAKTKAECYSAFPLLTPGTGANQSNTAARRNQRVYELQTCLNQWNDLEPNLVRSYDNTQLDSRLSADLRFDFRVNDNLTVYAKYNISNREVDRQYRWRSLSGGQELGLNPGNQYFATTNPNGVWDVALGASPLVSSGNVYLRSVPQSARSRYYLYDGVGIFNNQAALGNVSSIDPSTVKVDANHYVTEYVMRDAGSNITQSWEPFSTESSYAQFGGTYKRDSLRIDFLAGKSKSTYERFNVSTNRFFNYGAARFFVQPSGLWSHEILGSYDETNPANYVQLNTQAAQNAAAPTVDNPAGLLAYSVAQRPLVSGSFGLNFDAWMGESDETTAKVDLTYQVKDKLPFFTVFKSGVQFRNPTGKAWSRPGGMTIRSASGTYGQPGYVAPIVLPSTVLRGSFRACQPTSTSIEPCNYGYVANTALASRLTGVTTFTPAQLQQIIGDTIAQPDSNFFAGYEGAENMKNWQGIDVQKLMSLVPSAQNYNFDCVKTCMASDGKMYDQPYSGYDEKFTAAYFMAEFEHDLPFGMSFEGNVGLRTIKTEASGIGLLTISAIRTTAAFDSNNPGAAAGITTTSISRNAAITRESRDWLPTYNIGLWVVPDQVVLRYYKGKTIARPGVDKLLPAGTCEIDQRRTLSITGYDEDNRCSARVGNPELKPYTAWDQNLSIEWYPNKDTMFSLATHKLDVRIGNPIGVTKTSKLFEGTDLVDPVTGQSLADLDYVFPTWENAPGLQRTGWEFTTKTAFTFLPWYFRYTGADFNYSKLKSETPNNIVNPNTGKVMPPPRESSYFANLSIWYDDGKTNARISYQGRGEYFICIEACGGNGRNNYPGELNFDARPAPYQPGNELWQDETKYIDAKITHKFRPNVEFYFEGRNLTKQGTTTSNGADRTFADGSPTIQNLQYGGRTFSMGVTYRMGN